MSWDNARTFCLNKNAHLAELETMEEIEAVQAFFQSYYPTCNEFLAGSFWIGAREVTGFENIFTWFDSQTIVEEFDWAPSYPINDTAVDEAIMLNCLYDYSFGDQNVSHKQNFLCEGVPAS